MLLTRWKLMAGVLGVSIGGLAAAASQCPKLDKTKGRQPEAPVTAEAPKLPPAGAPSAAPKLPDLPSAPQLAPAGVTPPAPAGVSLPVPLALPDSKLSPPAAVADVPKVPGAPDAGLPALPDFPAPTNTKPAKPEEPKAAPAGLALPPAPDTKPATPPMTPPKPVAEAPKIAPIGDLVPPAPAKPNTLPAVSTLPEFGPPATTNQVPSKPTTPPPVMPISGVQPKPELPATGGTAPLSGKPSGPATNGTGASSPGAPPALPVPTEQPAVLDVPPSKPTPAPADAGVVKVGAMKYRILLRVGEGEPTFEVKSGDDLVFKVACEKVDIKSPEKGAGLSSVTARGKVRFAGFGVEGTCEELSFMAGTGEVSMAGEVKVQMKDKLGRVESELSTSTLKYKIDANVVGAAIKP